MAVAGTDMRAARAADRRSRKRAVEHNELLDRCGGWLAVWAVGKGVREVVQAEHVVDLIAIDTAVERAAVVAGIGERCWRPAEPWIQ